MRNRLKARLAILPILFVIACVLPLSVRAQTPWVCSATVPVAPKQMDISINANQFKITFGPDFGPPAGTYTWHARGFVIRAFTTTTEWAHAHATPTYNAQFAYGPDELNVINSWGTNMLRFLVSEKVLSNDQTWYTPAERTNYMTCLRNAIQLARNNGFVADIAMQAECPAGDCTGPNARNPMATQQTKDAWAAINSWFKNDKGVVYELYNEPGGDPTVANWKKYLHDGDSTVVPQNEILKQVRAAGSKNVVIIDGLDVGKSLQNILNSQVVNGGGYPIHDPIEDSVITTPQIAYGVHFYPDGKVWQNSDFDTMFGNQHAAQLPVVITEFAAWGTPLPQAGQDPGMGLAGQPVSQVIRFINYLNTNKIGLSASAFDATDVMVQAITPQGGTPPPHAWEKNYYNCYVTGSSVQVSPMPNVGTLVYHFYQHNFDSYSYTLNDSYATGVSCQ